MSTEHPISNPSKAAAKPNGSRSLNARSRTLLYGSLALNAVFIAALVAVVVLCNVRTYWFSTQLHNAYQRTCPEDVAQRTETKRSGDIVTNTYYVSSQALESGCTDSLIQAAQLDDYRAYPDHARIAGDMFKQLAPGHVLNITVVKSAENKAVLSPLQVKH